MLVPESMQGITPKLIIEFLCGSPSAASRERSIGKE